MADTPAENTQEPARREAAGDAARVRFKGIVESERAAGAYGVLTVDRDERRWTTMARQITYASRLVALFVCFSSLVGPPLGNYLAHRQIYGSAAGWQWWAAYDANTILFVGILPLILLLVGYAASRMATMVNAAESIAAAAQQYVTPDVTAAHNADAVGEVVRGHMTALNEGLDGALTRLASVEAMIRQHVEAIEIAGDAIEHKATGAVTRVASERSRLMELTESLNTHADAFAAAIADRAQASIEALQSADTVSLTAERDFDDRLGRLEDAAARAVGSFESLRAALAESTGSFAAGAETISQAAAHTEAATKRANAAANAAAESAALNAANVSASAQRALDQSRKAADAAIAEAAKEAERISGAAIDAAAREAAKVQEATAKALSDVSGNTAEAVEAARADAEKASKAAGDVSDAARLAGQAAQKASKDVAAASEQARKSADEALSYSQDAADRVAERNKALADARAALEKENARLESLIEEQRQRADRLAEAIASQTDRLTRLAEAQLREQEAAARLAEAQNKMQERAAKEAEEQRAAEARAAVIAEQTRAAERDAAARAAAEQASARQTQPQTTDETADTGTANEPGRERDTPSGTNGAARLDALARDIAERRPRRTKDGKFAAKKKKRPTQKAPSGKSAATRSTPERIGAAAQADAANETKSRRDVSWREILDAAEDAEPLELTARAKPKPAAKTAPKPAPAPDQRASAHAAADDGDDAIRVISRLQAFTFDLETRLYGDPPPALLERYERGDRNVFANRLLRLNEADVKRRIRSESARDRDFERNVQGFLQGFEKLLEDATTSETADEELEEYLSSPLGRVYLLIGATVGYFA